MTSPNRRDLMAMTAATAAAATLPAGSASAQTPPPGAQAPGFYRFRVGDIVVTAINDGFVPRAVEGFVRNASVEDVRSALAASFLPTDSFQNTFTTLVLQIGQRLVVLDTGFADNGPPTTGTWLANFRAAGYDPAQVNQVVISHFHGDHISGIRNRDGSLRFPNAEISVPAPEWDFWMSDERMNAVPENARGGFQGARRVFAPIAANVRRFTPGVEVAPGVTSIAAHGHSPGHTIFAITSGNGRMLFVADITSHPALFVRNPDWSAIFDMDADAARATRRRVLDMAASERMQLSFYHAPFPATGFVARDGNGFAFVPVQWTSGV